MKRTILTALFALNSLFCVNQLHAISWKKLVWGSGALASSIGAVITPSMASSAFTLNVMREVLFPGLRSKLESERLARILGIGLIATASFIISAKLCYDKYKEQPE
jgi:hypothetical protein